MVNMGLIPRTANFSDLLNHKYEPPPIYQVLPEDTGENFFATNPQLAQQP